MCIPSDGRTRHPGEKFNLVMNSSGTTLANRKAARMIDHHPSGLFMEQLREKV